MQTSEEWDVFRMKLKSHDHRFCLEQKRRYYYRDTCYQFCHYFTTIDIISQQEIFDSPVSSPARPGRQSGDPI